MTSGGFLTSWARAVVASAQSAIGHRRRQRTLTAMDRLTLLPTAVLARIFAFADGAFITEYYPHSPQLPLELFVRLEEASADVWRPIVEELTREYEASVVRFEFSAVDIQCGRPDDGNGQDGSSRLVTRLARDDDGSVSHVRCLQLGLEMLEYRSNFEVVKARTYAERFDHARVDWDAVFELCPKLQRLDLSGFPLRSTHLPVLLQAAARHCHKLKSLTLPDKEWYRGPVGMDAHEAMRALYAALEQWHHYGGGLRQLTIPQRTTLPDAPVTRRALADELLLAVATFCPQLEHLDGWKVSLRDVDGVLRCDERIDCSPHVWRLFCCACPKLQEIQWCIFPFTDACFTAFAATPRPHVKRLTLATDVSSFRSDAAAATGNEDGDAAHYGCAASSVFQAVAACPALEELSVVLQDELSDRSELPTANIVSDALLETLATHCRGLKKLSILQAESGGANMFTRDHLDEAQSITDRGLAQLATLPELRVFHMNVGSHCSADGLLALVINAPQTGRPRELELVVGSYDASLYSRGLGQWTLATLPPHKHCIQFHAVLLEFLALLVAHRDDVAGRRFVLLLHNGSSLYVDDDDAWQCHLEAVAQQLTVAFPTLQLHVVRQGGIAGISLRMLSDTVGSMTGIQPSPSRSRQKNATGATTDWGKVAWYATIQALALTAAFSYQASARMA